MNLFAVSYKSYKILLILLNYYSIELLNIINFFFNFIFLNEIIFLSYIDANSILYKKND